MSTDSKFQNWYYLPANQIAATAGWLALNQDNGEIKMEVHHPSYQANNLLGFIEPANFGTSDIACHKSAKSTSNSIPVKAGDTLKLTWNTWPDSHHGPVIDYLAKVNSHSASTSPGSLSFFKIAESGLINDASPPGVWASDNLLSSSFSINYHVDILLTKI